MGPVRQSEARLYVPFEVYDVAMEFSDEEQEDLVAITSHVIGGLARENLLEDLYVFGTPRDMRDEYRRLVPRDGFIVAVTPSGVELFVAAHGRRGRWDPFLDESLPVLESLKIDYERCWLLKELPHAPRPRLELP